MKDYYQQLEPIAHKQITHYLVDFTKYDRPHLEGSKNITRSFIWCCRNTGTHMIELLKTECIFDREQAKHLNTLKYVINHMGNCVFYHLHNGTIEKITQRYADSMITNHISNYELDCKLYG